jgi:AcrR family transcriptional regulator/predicted DNA-binding transcriptional regulator AlpA
MDKDFGSQQRWVRINELAEITGVSRYTIHYYLKEELLPPPLKTARTMALYNDIHIDCLRFIQGLRKQGRSIMAIRKEVRQRFGKLWKSAGASGRLDGKDPTRGPKGNRQRQRIIETAVEFFSQKGYHRTHVGHITDALHLSKGAFYQYFENKDDLFVAVFDHLISLLTRNEETIAKEPNFLVRMRERARAYLAFYKQYHKIFDIIRAESIGQEDKTGMSIEAIYQRMLGPLVEDIKKAQKEGRIRSGNVDPEMRTFMLFGAFDFICYNSVKGRPYSLEKIFDKMDGIFLR